MKNIHDYINVEQNDDKKCSINCHKITIDSKNRQKLGEHKFSEIKNYFKTLKTKFEDESSGKYRVLVPKDAYDLKVLIDDLNTILNS
ncbi:hypothetical protein [Clostridium sp. Ade.TY]|uniref:hypothetical protein n=1 Tax=Clostridium sp. Ade.TY TaxID=1391647 RepID=UPI0003F69C78|nr:hypothetical protein [Clostridium sp. Ade.TY]